MFCWDFFLKDTKTVVLNRHILNLGIRDGSLHSVLNSAATSYNVSLARALAQTSLDKCAPAPHWPVTTPA